MRDLSLQHPPVRTAEGTALPLLPRHGTQKITPGDQATATSILYSTQVATTVSSRFPAHKPALLSPCSRHKAALEGRKVTCQPAHETPVHGHLRAAVKVQSCEGLAKLRQNTPLAQFWALKSSISVPRNLWLQKTNLSASSQSAAYVGTSVHTGKGNARALLLLPFLPFLPLSQAI